MNFYELLQVMQNLKDIAGGKTSLRDLDPVLRLQQPRTATNGKIHPAPICFELVQFDFYSNVLIIEPQIVIFSRFFKTL